MKKDRNGISTCPRGCEQYDTFHHKSRGYVQYEYRADDGVLFTIITDSLVKARLQRDIWLQNKSKKK